MASKVSTFTSKGNAAPYSQGSGKLANLGREIDGKIYKHPRLVGEPLSGRNVVTTNPAASGTRGRNSRTASLGMGGKLSRGRNRDF